MITLTRRQALALLGTSTGSALLACGPGPQEAPASVAGDATAGSVPLHYRSLQETAALLRSREVTSLELTEALLTRVAELDGQLQSYATVMSDHALDSARRADDEIAAARYLGPLHGVPIAVKDLCYTRGVPTKGGLAVRADFVPEHDGTVVRRLTEAGAILLGKLNLTEGAMGGYHPDFAIPVNPWDPDLWPGASSSGSGVATAAGLCFASLGSDTGGSIRFPAAQCGLVGLKPTWGRVSRFGVLELAGSLDHIGPMTRSVADAAIVFETIAGADPDDPTTLTSPVQPVLATLRQGVEGLRLGIDRGYLSRGVDPAVAEVVMTATDTWRGLGAELVDVTVPDAPLDDWGTLCSYEAARAHAATYPTRADDYGPYFREFLAGGTAVTDEQYAAATVRRDAFTAEFEAMLGTIDALVCPSVPTQIPMVDGMGYDSQTAFGEAMAEIAQRFDPPLGSLQLFTTPADFAGTPTISLPCGFSDSGAPHSVQLVGRDETEAVLCRIAHAYEQATPWHTQHPNL